MKSKIQRPAAMFLALLLAAPVSLQANTTDSHTVDYGQGGVSSSYADIPMVDFLEALCQAANIELHVVETLDRSPAHPCRF